MSSVSKVGSSMRKLGWLFLLLAACGSEEPRTQITLMIDADPRVKAEVDNVRVSFSSAPIGSAAEDFVARAPQDFSTPLSWPLVLVLVPAGDDANRAFRVEVAGRSGTTTLVGASARSHFIKGKTLALRMRLHDACRVAVFGSCNDTETCVVSNGTPSCADNEIDPNALPPFVSVDPESDAGTDAQVPVVREVTGRVFSTDGLLPLVGARVAVASGTPATTDADGAFTLTRAAGDDALSVEHPDHAVAFKTLPDADSVYLEVFVKRVDARQVLAATVGGRVSGAKGANAVFPPNAFKQADGTIERGMADVTIAVPDTKDPAQAQAFPGDFKATATGGKQGALSAVSALDLSATSPRGKLNIADGEEAEVSFPAKPTSTRTTEDLWSFDTVEQSWKKEGTATLTQDSSGNVVYRGKVKHLSWWAVGTLIEETTCMHLCATYNGTAAAYARATVSGIDQPFQGSFYADATGCVAFEVPLSTQVSVSVQSIDGVAAPQVTISGDTPASIDDLSGCLALGDVTLVARTSANDMCPGSSIACGTDCVDINTDKAHCGGCVSSSCRNDQSCVDAACACSNSETLCGTCTDLNSDARNCGACGTVCGTGQRCVQGACVDPGCAPPTVSCNGICVDLSRDGVNGQCPMLSMPECVVPADCTADEMCDDAGACVPIATCTDDTDCPSAYRCDAFMTNVCVVPNCGMVGYTYCRGGIACVNLNDNPNSCGACGLACDGGERCENGTCMTCPDPNCNAVGATCGPLSNGCGVAVDCGTCQVMGETCGGGGVPNQCGTSDLCGDGMVTGSEACDDGDASSNDGCSATCQIEFGWDCPVSGGVCTMQTDPCNGIDDDSDTFTDEDFVPNNCGVSDGECIAGMTTCSFGSVVCVGEVGPVAEVCDGLDNDCDGAVDNGIDLQTDVNNCGACNLVCNVVNGTPQCTAGSCQVAVCNAGWTNCDGTATNGCESNLLIDSNNCGSCGNVCPGVTTCSTGLCL